MLPLVPVLYPGNVEGAMCTKLRDEEWTGLDPIESVCGNLY